MLLRARRAGTTARKKDGAIAMFLRDKPKRWAATAEHVITIS
jgi:hypothetical protein